MKLYFTPLACSLASRISLYEADVEVDYVEVDARSKRTADGQDFRHIHPLGLVPALEIEPGDLLTENAAVLQHIAELRPAARLGATNPRATAQLRKWLSFVGTELHKSVYQPFFQEAAPPEAKSYALSRAPAALDWLSSCLESREFLLDHFSVADAYLFTVLNWSAVTPIDLPSWPTLAAYHARLLTRDSVARAFADERPLYVQQLARWGGADGAHPPLPGNA